MNASTLIFKSNEHQSQASVHLGPRDCYCPRCVYVSVYPPLRLLIASEVMWHDMDPYDWLNKFCSFYMTAIDDIVSM